MNSSSSGHAYYTSAVAISAISSIIPLFSLILVLSSYWARGKLGDWMTRSTILIVLGSLSIAGYGATSAYNFHQIDIDGDETQSVVWNIIFFTVGQYCYVRFSFERASDIVRRTSKKAHAMCVVFVMALPVLQLAQIVSQTMRTALPYLGPSFINTFTQLFFISTLVIGFFCVVFDSVLLYCFVLFLRYQDGIVNPKLNIIAHYGIAACCMAFLVMVIFIGAGLAERKVSFLLDSLICLGTSILICILGIMKYKLFNTRVASTIIMSAEEGDSMKETNSTKRNKPPLSRPNSTCQ
ncbi:hypothetical protein BCR33DRAFT_710929, partial [Rhizoclosmatium globosum]